MSSRRPASRSAWIAQFVQGSDEFGRVEHIRWANGEQGIDLSNGCRLKFAARTGGSGRGFAGCSTSTTTRRSTSGPSRWPRRRQQVPSRSAKFGAHGRQVWFARVARVRDVETVVGSAPAGPEGQRRADAAHRSPWSASAGQGRPPGARGAHRRDGSGSTRRASCIRGAGPGGSAHVGARERAYRFRIEHEFLEDQLALLGPELFARAPGRVGSRCRRRKLDHDRRSRRTSGRRR